MEKEKQQLVDLRNRVVSDKASLEENIDILFATKAEINDAVDSAGNTYSAEKINQLIANIPSGGIEEAPVDGSQYGRKDGEWTEVVAGSFSGTMDDITNGLTYVKTENNLTDALLANLHAPGSDDQDLSGLVVKVTGYSLVADTEISKIHASGSDNQDLSGYALKTFVIAMAVAL